MLAATGALLPGETELVVNVDEARYGARNLGALQATITQQEDGVGFSLESAATALAPDLGAGEMPEPTVAAAPSSAPQRRISPPCSPMRNCPRSGPPPA